MHFIPMWASIVLAVLPSVSAFPFAALIAETGTQPGPLRCIYIRF